MSAVVYSKEHLLEHVMSALPPDICRDDWLQALPRALVAGEGGVHEHEPGTGPGVHEHEPGG